LCVYVCVSVCECVWVYTNILEHLKRKSILYSKGTKFGAYQYC
jgi:hypothetical protein